MKQFKVDVAAMEFFSVHPKTACGFANRFPSYILSIIGTSKFTFIYLCNKAIA